MPEVQADGMTGGLPRGLNVLLTLAAGIIVVAGIRAFSGTIGPILLALIVVVAVSPIRTALRRRGAPGWVATGALVVAAYGILLAVLGSLVWSATELVKLFTGPTYEAQLAETRADLAELIERVGVEGAQTDGITDLLDIGTIAGQLTSALSGVLGLAGSLSLLLFTLFFLSLDAAGFGRALDRVAEDRKSVTDALTHFASTTRTYFVVSSVFGLIVAVLDVAALLALGIPLALVWGLLSFITNYIPNIGFVLGLIPPAILGFFEGGWTLSLAVIAIYSVINVIIQSIIQPKFVGDAVGLSVTLTFVSLIFWGWVIGPLGALLAVPLTLLAKAMLIDLDPTTLWAAPLITLEPGPSSENGAEPGAGSAPARDPVEARHERP